MTENNKNLTVDVGETIKNTYEATGIAVMDIRHRGDTPGYAYDVDIIDKHGPKTIVIAVVLVAVRGVDNGNCECKG